MMKHTERLPDNWVSHPKFAYKLIGCLAIAFILGVLGAVVMYFYVSVISEVSEYRKNFNNGYTQSRDFFEQNELLLAGMIKSVNFVSGLAAPASNPGKERFYLQPLPAPDSHNGILNLSAQMRKELRESNVNIICVDMAAGVARYVFKSDTSNSNKLKQISEQLQDVDGSKQLENGLHVFQLGTGNEKKSYIFEPISSRLMPHAWLGIEVPHARVQKSIMSEMNAAPQLGIKYMILDKNGRIISSVPELDLNDHRTIEFLNAMNNKGDGFESYGAPVFNVSLKKELGGGRRWVVYYASYSDVLWQVRYSVVFGCLVFIASLGSAYIVMRYMRRAVFLPAQEQAVQLMEREAFNRTMLELAPVGICVFSRESGKLLLQSEKAKAMLASYVEMGGCRASLREFFMSVPLKGGETSYRTGVTTFTPHESTQRYIHVSLAELQYNDQPVLFCSFVDDSERRRAELMMAAAKEAADEANAAKSTFLAMMSHEIRTPLYGVLGTLELLGNTTLLPQQRGYLGTIEHSSSNLRHIIDDILDFSKIEANQLALELGQFNLIELAQHVARSFVSLAQKKGVELYCCLQPDLPLLVGDRNRLQQVLSNLLSNAVKFTDSGKIVIRIGGVKNAAGRFDVRIQVSDSGIGIAKASQAKLFEPFIQADHSTARRFGGTGLGLSICRKLVELMGGEVNLVSELGLGSSFSLLLDLPIAGTLQPISLAGLSTVQVLAGANEQRETLLALIEHAGGRAYPLTGVLPASAHNDVLLVTWPHRPEMTFANRFAGVVWLDPQGASIPEWREDGWHVSSLCQQGIVQALQRAGGNEPGGVRASPVLVPAVPKTLHVLAVEDHPINQRVLTEQLQQLGCQVTMTSDGREALQRWQRGESFDVVLTDVNMPELDGYQLTRRLRAEGIKVPIVGVTANAQTDETERCLQAGMDGYLAKPVSLAGLKQELLRIGGLR
ncbi:response regulator [Pseudomonas gessardii]|uniref:response regulator n=1 Tax=Pseudomonas gessardii TaxID=78544 RepID=UPI0014742D85|nr:response regulator [Pseudomonas gessardii]NNA68305.1 response regulator [Pseudomonas gessardii]